MNPLLSPAEAQLLQDLSKPTVTVIGRARLTPLLALIERLQVAQRLSTQLSVAYQHLASAYLFAGTGQLSAAQIDENAWLSQAQKDQCHALAATYQQANESLTPS